MLEPGILDQDTRETVQVDCGKALQMKGLYLDGNEIHIGKKGQASRGPVFLWASHLATMAERRRLRRSSGSS